MPSNLHSQATRFLVDLDKVDHVSINRWVEVSKNARQIEIHGFCDASERAYVAVVYLRIVDSTERFLRRFCVLKPKLSHSNCKAFRG